MPAVLGTANVSMPQLRDQGRSEATDHMAQAPVDSETPAPATLLFQTYQLLGSGWVYRNTYQMTSIPERSQTAARVFEQAVHCPVPVVAPQLRMNQKAFII